MDTGSQNVPVCPAASVRGKQKMKPSLTSKKRFRDTWMQASHSIAALEEDHLPVPEERFETLVVAV